MERLDLMDVSFEMLTEEQLVETEDRIFDLYYLEG
jgi:hypothetical protein